MAAIEAIATTYLEADVASVAFTGIPQTYKHLQLRISSRDSHAADTVEVAIRLGALAPEVLDTGASYYSQEIRGYQTTESGSTNGPQTSIKCSFSTGTNIDMAGYGCGVVNILDYRNTDKMKSYLATGGQPMNATGYSWISTVGGLWNGEGAIDKITIGAQGFSTNLVRGSFIAIYGLNV